MDTEMGTDTMPMRGGASVGEGRTMEDRIRVEKVEVLSDNHYVLSKATFGYRRTDGAWETQVRESYDRGNGATILLYDPARRTVVLTRQFRYPAFANPDGGSDGWLIEAPAGLLDDAAPAERIALEAEEETGFRPREVREVLSAFMSPGSVTERLHFFVAAYTVDDRVGEGGGVVGSGEDIEVLEPTIDAALAMIETGEIADAKTILLLQYAALTLFGGK